MQTYGQGMHLGILELERDRGSSWRLKQGRLQVVNADELIDDARVAERIAKLEADIQTCSRLLVTFMSPLSGATTANRLWVRWWPVRSEKPHKQRSE